MVKKKHVKSGIKIRGFARVQLQENGKVVGDSGWVENLVTNLGFQDFICLALAGNAGSKYVGFMGIGTGSTCQAADTTLASEITNAAYSRISVATSTIASKTVQFTASWASSASHLTAAQTINNIGLFDLSAQGSSVGARSRLFAGTTFTTSQWNSNQDLLATYQIRFATA